MQRSGTYAMGTVPAGPFTITPEQDLVLFADVSFGSGVWTLVVTTFNGSSFNCELRAGQVLRFPGAIIGQVVPPAANTSVFFAYVARDYPSPFGSTSFANVTATQGGTWSVTSSAAAAASGPVDSQAFSGSIAAGTADAVSQAGAVALPVGSLVRYRLAVAGGLITAADPLTYVRLVGATSGVIYAAAYVTSGGAGNVMGEIRMPASEKLDVHTANADSVAHVFTASWESFPFE